MATSTPKVSRRERFRQIRTAFSFTHKHDPKFLPLIVGVMALPIVVALVFAAITQLWFPALPFGIMLALTAGMFVFGRRSSTAMYNEVAGKPGAAAAVLDTMRGDWRVTPAVQMNPQQDLVHRVIGKPGVMLVAEGSSPRVKGLLGQETKRVRRVAGPGVEVLSIIVGDGEGEVPIPKLSRHLMKLPKTLTPKQVNALDKRLTAIGGANIAIPKGPMPKGARLPKGAKMPRG
jgi:hypothetical protein